MLTARTFRLFVSSTFSDFIAEREALQREVFPKLERHCAERGARFQAVDLRWGITEEAQREHDTMRICLEEVRRCQQLSPRPNFAVLLGDRYGWEPVPARIPQDHWKRLKAAARKESWALIEESYRKDANAIPPMYCLRERPKDPSVAFQREAQLLEALRHAARGFRGSARLPYCAAATHQEIALGALSRRDEGGRDLRPDQHVHVYVRHLDGLPEDASARDFIDWDAESGLPVPGARERLRGLEKQLRRQLGGNVHDLRAGWSRHGRNGAVNKAYLKRFSDLFLEHQLALIDAELASLEQLDEFQQRERAHHDFGAERARVFAGRKTLLARIAAGKPAAPNAPLVLLGGGGSGKSALLARAASEMAKRAEGSGTVVIQRYIGGVPGTESLMTTLTALTADIANRYGQPQPPAPESAKALAEAFAASLAHATAERPLTLFLDALDQLSQNDSAWMLEWLPKELPEHVRVVASARTGTSVEQSVRRRFPRSIIDVPPMKPAEGREMLKAWLADKRAAWFNAGIAPSKGRRLTVPQRQALLAAFGRNGSALWLKLAYEEAATWASWDKSRELPATVQGLIEDLVDKRLLERENHPRAFTERALAYLTAGRFGLSETELARALGTDPVVREEFRRNEKTQRKWDDERALPPILWSRLFFDLQPYLGLAQVAGALLMRWFHREFGEVLTARYLGSADERKLTHGALADTFLTLERELRPHENNDDALFRSTDVSGKQVSAALRRVMEQPWQLAQAGRHDDLRSLLTDFGFCMGRCATNSVADLINDYLPERGRPSGDPLGAWADCISVSAHLLRRGEERWPAHKILLQVAMEHADDSPITLAAQKWLERGMCDWVWVKRLNRPIQYQRSPLLAVMEGHTSSVNGADVSPDGRVLTWSHDSTLRLWDGQSGAELAVMEGHTDNVEGARFLPGGRVLSWSHDKTLRLWDGQRGAALAVLGGHTKSVVGAEVFHDGRVLSWSDDGTLRLWDGQSGAALAVLAGHTESVVGAEFLHDGQVLSWSRDCTLRVWDGQSGAALLVMEGHTESVVGAEVLHNGRVLSWSGDRTLRLWDRRSGAALAVLEGHAEMVKGAQILPDGRVLSWSGDGTLRLWDGQSGAVLAVMEGHSGKVAGAQALPDGRILSWSWDKTLRLWDGQSGAALVVMEGHTHWVIGAKALPDGRVLSWSVDNTLRLWGGDGGVALAVLEGHTSGVSGAQVLPDGCVLSWSSDRTLRLWDGQSGGAMAVLQGHSGRVNGARVLHDGRILSWSWDKTLRLWDGQSGAALAVLKGHTSRVNDAQLMPDGRVLSWSGDGTLRLWDGQSGAALAVMEGHTSGVSGAQVLPDGCVLSWSGDRTLRLWGGQSGGAMAVLEGHSGRVTGATVLHDRRILSWSVDNTLRLWDGQSGVPLLVMEGHTSSVNGARVLPDGRIVSWSDDKTLRLWDGTRGAALAVMEGHADSVNGVHVLPDGRILSWSDDKTLRLWDGTRGAALTVMEGHADWISGAQALPDGRMLSWSMDNMLRLWDGRRGAIMEVIRQPWIFNPKRSADWRGYASQLAGAQLAGNLWAQGVGASLAFAHGRDHWRALWHGEEFCLVGLINARAVCNSGHHLVFLQLMRGAVPITATHLA